MVVCVINKINKIQRDATLGRRVFTAKFLYMFLVSVAPIIRSTSNCNCSVFTGHIVKATTFLQRGLIKPRWSKAVAVPEAAVRDLYIPDDGCDGRPKHLE